MSQGDFVALLSAGMSVRQAVTANFVSSCFCFMGLVCGKMVGEIEDVHFWILGVTAGFFLYIALTNKVSNTLLENVAIINGRATSLETAVFHIRRLKIYGWVCLLSAQPRTTFHNRS